MRESVERKCEKSTGNPKGAHQFFSRSGLFCLCSRYEEPMS